MGCRVIFGGQTVTVVNYEDRDLGALGTYERAEVLTEVKGCRHRPLPFSEAPEGDTDVATMTFKTTAPPVPEVLAVKPDGVLRVGGIDHHVVGGPRVDTDLYGQPYKATVVSRRMSR